jgi:16S rRNA (uracil1498-N3)-methyltransferase
MASRRSRSRSYKASHAAKWIWIVQKATELGVARLVPITTQRSVVQLDGERADKRSSHWRSVAIAACEQSGRNRLPEIATPVPLDAACAIAATRGIGMHRYALAPGDAPDFASVLRALYGPGATPPRLTLLVGPEGGAHRGRTPADQMSFSPVSLRLCVATETAGAAAIAGRRSAACAS